MIDYYKDIPDALNSNYSSCEGTLTKAYYPNLSKQRGTKFFINDTEFYISSRYKDFFIKGTKYKVEYLPNSKYVINIYKYY